jgi:hypothetical protein
MKPAIYGLGRDMSTKERRSIRGFTASPARSIPAGVIHRSRWPEAPPPPRRVPPVGPRRSAPNRRRTSRRTGCRRSGAPSGSRCAGPRPRSAGRRHERRRHVRARHVPHAPRPDRTIRRRGPGAISAGGRGVGRPCRHFGAEAHQPPLGPHAADGVDQRPGRRHRSAPAAQQAGTDQNSFHSDIRRPAIPPPLLRHPGRFRHENPASDVTSHHRPVRPLSRTAPMAHLLANHPKECSHDRRVTQPAKTPRSPLARYLPILAVATGAGSAGGSCAIT